MKAVIISCVLVLTLSSFGCRQDPVSPQATSTVTLSSELEIPEPKLVPYTNIPYPAPNTLYRISGVELADGPNDVLERVLEEEFDLQRAWHPQVALCMALFLDELIIELAGPDDAIYELGFTSDFAETVGPCASHWNEYNFANDE